MPSIKVTGLDELQKKLKENVNLQDVKKVVRHNGAQLQQRMQEKADFVKGYQTGATKLSIHMEPREDGFAAEVGATTLHAPYLEHGTRFMDAQPFIQPAFDEQSKKFKSDMQRLMK